MVCQDRATPKISKKKRRHILDGMNYANPIELWLSFCNHLPWLKLLTQWQIRGEGGMGHGPSREPRLGALFWSSGIFFGLKEALFSSKEAILRTKWEVSRLFYGASWPPGAPKPFPLPGANPESSTV